MSTKTETAARIREHLPLEWAVGTLFGLWVTGNEMEECPFPDHADSTPSFNLWAPDENGKPQRFGCFGCHKTGDVIDLVSLARGGLGFDDACEASVKLIERFEASGWVGPPHVAPSSLLRQGKTPEEFAEIVVRLSDMSVWGQRVLDRFCQAKAEESNRPDFASSDFITYAVEEWGWGGAGPAESVRGAALVFFPHRTPSGDVTAIKYRDPRLDGGRWNEDGSRFPYLYGCWRSKRAKETLICEGETDTVWAAYALRNRADIDVFGLPSGASQKPTDAILRSLAARKTVYLAFDGDNAGRDAGERWRGGRRLRGRASALTADWAEALEKTGSANGRIVRLPEGEDLLSSGTPVRDLLESATVPRRPPTAVAVVEGVFVRWLPKKGDAEPVAEPIADFGVTLERELETEDGPGWEGRFLDDGRPFTIRQKPDLLNANALGRWAATYGRNYLGPSARTVPVLSQWFSAESSFLPLEKTSTRAGKIGRSYVWPGGNLGPDRLRYVPPTGDVHLADRLKLRSGPFDLAVIRTFETLNDPAVMAAILGWLTASLLRGRRAPAPALFVTGEAGAGKTKMLEALLGGLGFGVWSQLSSTTPYAVDNLIDSVTGFPVWFDEYRLSAREDALVRLQQLLRDAYNGQSSQKGQMTPGGVTLAEVQTWAAIIVSGEMGTAETSHMDRLLVLDLDPAAKNAEAFDSLTAYRRSRPEDGLGYALLRFLVERPESLFRPDRFDVADVPDRFREVLGFVRAGWRAWGEFRRSVGVTEPLAEPDYIGLSAARREAVDPWLEALLHADGVMSRDGDPIVGRTPDGHVKVRPYEVVKEARNVGIRLPAGATELRKWLERHYPGTAKLPKTSGGKRYDVVPGLDLDLTGANGAKPGR